MDWEEYDVGRIEKNKKAKALYDLALKSDIKNVDIALDLLRKLEGLK